MNAKMILRDDDGYEGQVVAAKVLGGRMLFITTDRMYESYSDDEVYLTGFIFKGRNLPESERFKRG